MRRACSALRGGSSAAAVVSLCNGGLPCGARSNLAKIVGQDYKIRVQHPSTPGAALYDRRELRE